MRLPVFLLVGTLVPVLACGPAPAAPPPPSRLRVSALLDQVPERVRAQHAALLERVCADAGVACEWTPVATYEELVDRFARHELDLAFMGGATFAMAQARAGARPLVMRDIDFLFTSSIYVRAEDPARTLADLRGRRLAFGPRRSTSGYFMPRFFLERLGLVPERHFSSVTHSVSHENSLAILVGGEVDAVAVNTSLAEQLLRAGAVDARRVRAIWQSPPFVDYVWVVQRDLAPDFAARLRDAFLDLDPSRPEDQAALAAEAAGGFLPAYPGDFTRIAAIVRQAGVE